MLPADYERFAHALCDAELPPPPGLRVPAGVALAERFAVHRNTVHVGLVDALREAYPVVRAQVGEEFFRAMARAFVQRHKPATPVLARYGEHFADFITGFEPASGLPWLPDLARLERAWSECWSAAEAPALPLTALGTLLPEQLALARFKPHPAARLLQSRWPVADLWEAHQADAVPDLASLEWRPQNVLLSRPQGEVLLHRLDDGAARVTAALLAQDSIEAAATKSTGTDAGALLGMLFDAGVFTHIHQ